MLQKFLAIFQPAKAIPRLSSQEIDLKYPRFRWQILESTFVGYAVFYFVRGNFSVVSKEVGEALSYSKNDIGDILFAFSISYAVGKFVMGSLSDRSNPKIFMPFGLLLTAILNFSFGSTDSLHVHIALWGLNGLAQGMGWPPCGRSLGHWYSVRERGTIFATWNTAHNVGGGLIGVIAAYSASYFGWQYAFFVPGILALITAIYLFYRLVDTPQSLGLPPIEEYNNDYPESKETHEQELTAYQLIVENVLKNKYIWLFALSNFFVYMVRYSLIYWGPSYLKEMKGASLEGGGYSTLIYEFAAIVPTILIGWISDKTGGRRGMVSLLCMIPILFAFIGIIFTPPGYLWIDLSLFAIIGFFIYPPVMLLGVSGLDYTSKKAVGTAAGFIGFFGYTGSAIQGKAIGYLSTHYNWNVSLGFIVCSCVMAIILLSFTWNLKPKS